MGFITAATLLMYSISFGQCVESNSKKRTKIAATVPAITSIKDLVPFYESDDVSISIDANQSGAGVDLVAEYQNIAFTDSAARNRKLPISNVDPVDWYFAKAFSSCIENGCLVIYDKQKKRYMRSLTKNLFNYSECPAGSGAGREFSYNKIVILHVIDWLSS